MMGHTNGGDDLSHTKSGRRKRIGQKIVPVTDRVVPPKKMNKGNAKPPGLYANMNKRRAEGTSRPKSKSTVTPKAYANMKAGFPKKKKKK
jgi:hypothetical protein